VTVSLRYLDPKTNVVQRFTKLIYSGAITPQVASFDAQPITPRTAKLQWTYPIEYGPIQLSRFVIQVSTDYGSTWVDAATADPSNRSIEISELIPGSGYMFRVLAVSNVGNSTPSAGVVVNTPTPVFDGPTNFSASLIKTNSAKISWALLTPQSAVKNYLVDYSLDGVTWIPIKKSESKTTSYLSLSGLRMGTLYRFRIAATNKIETGEYSYLSFSTLALAPTSPTKLQPSLISSSNFTVDWVSPSSNGGSEITDYVVEINGGGFNWAPVAHSPSNNTSISITGLNPGVKYSVRVKAINSVGASKVSSSLSVTTLAVLPSSPMLTLKSKTATSVVLSWVAPANGGAKISDYKAEYSTDGGTSWLTVSKSASTSTSLTLKNLKTKTSYLFRVSAKNSVGYSAPSGTLAVTTP
jgi:titin